MAYSLLSFGLILMSGICQQGTLMNHPLPDVVANAERLESVGVSDPVAFNAFHIQGLVATPDAFIFTSVESLARRGWIFKADRQSLQCVQRRALAQGNDFHPGGMDFDGQFLWVPLAAYTRKSHARILSLDPATLEGETRWEVEDHIGALSRVENLLIGASWDAEDFYFWDLTGRLLETRKNPTGVAYQDCKGASGFLVCCGGDAVDWIEVSSWRLAKRFPVGKSLAGHSLCREGISLLKDRVFLMPDDGIQCRFYELKLSEQP